MVQADHIPERKRPNGHPYHDWPVIMVCWKRYHKIIVRVGGILMSKILLG